MSPSSGSDDGSGAISRSRRGRLGQGPSRRGRGAAIADRLVHDERANAAIGWALLLGASLLAAAMLRAGSVLWAAFAALIVVAVALPAVATRDWTAMVPWPVVALVTVAVLIRSVGLYPEIAGYLAVSGLALVIVVEIEAATSVEMSRSFAVFFAVLTTMALQSWWTIAQFYSDRWLGTDFLTTQTELQWDLVAVTVVGIVVGGIFQWYFEQFEHVGTHKRPIVPEEP